MNTGVDRMIMNHLTEEAMLFSSILDVPEEMEKKVRGRRRKAMKEDGEEAKKRRLSDEQVEFLEKSFLVERKLDTGRKIRLAEEAGLDPKQVAVWFQNRRTRWKCKRMEEDYNKLRSLHDTDVVEIHHLKAEALKLKEQLSEAQREIDELSYKYLCGGGGGGGCGGGYNNIGGGEFSSSASTAYSMNDSHSAWEFEQGGGMDGYNYNYMPAADMTNFYGF